MATERDLGKSSQTSLSSFEDYLAKWLELSGSSSGDFDALVDLIVKEQFTCINACSEELAVYLIERGPKGLVELTNGPSTT